MASYRASTVRPAGACQGYLHHWSSRCYGEQQDNLKRQKGFSATLGYISSPACFDPGPVIEPWRCRGSHCPIRIGSTSVAGVVVPGCGLFWIAEAGFGARSCISLTGTNRLGHFPMSLIEEVSLLVLTCKHDSQKYDSVKPLYRHRLTWSYLQYRRCSLNFSNSHILYLTLPMLMRSEAYLNLLFPWDQRALALLIKHLRQSCSCIEHYIHIRLSNLHSHHAFTFLSKNLLPRAAADEDCSICMSFPSTALCNNAAARSCTLMVSVLPATVFK